MSKMVPTEFLIDAYAFETLPGEVAYWQNKEAKQQEALVKMALSKTELTDMIERLDEIKTALNDIRHRLVQELEETAAQEA